MLFFVFIVERKHLLVHHCGTTTRDHCSKHTVNYSAFHKPDFRECTATGSGWSVPTPKGDNPGSVIGMYGVNNSTTSIL
mgnify:CR=1 FL=1